MTDYSENALNLFKKLYFKRDKDDNIIEEHPNQVFERVAYGVSYPLDSREKWRSIFKSMMEDGYFRPCTPCMMNVGVHENPQTAACFVGNLQDSLLSIFDFDKESGIIFSKGSGIGGNFGMLREEGALLSTGGRSSGPFAFLKKWAATADAVKSGGTCLSPDQPVFTNLGIKKIIELTKEKEFVVLSFDRNANRFMAKKAHAFESGIKELYELKTDKGVFHLSYDHPIMLSTGEYIHLIELKVGMSIQKCSINYSSGGYPRVNLSDGNKGKKMFHRMIMEDIFDVKFDNEVVHHLDGNKCNNSFENLSIMENNGVHSRLHNKEKVADNKHIFQLETFDHSGENNGMHRSSDFYKDKERVITYKQKQREILLKDPSRAKNMQKKSVPSKMISSIYNLINKGFLKRDFKSFDDIIKARVKYWGKSGTKREKQIETFIKHFGNFNNLKRALDDNNHSVIAIKRIGLSKVYDIEVICDSPNDMTMNDNHNFLICPMGTEGYVGNGIVVHNSRRAAEMCMFTDTHPDLIKFITIKNGVDQEILKSMNLSIAATDAFMEAVENDEMWELYGVKDGLVKSKHKAKDIYEKITQNAFNTGDPGLWFTDRANETNGLVRQYGRMLSTNPCGEISGTPYFACALASINLAKFVVNNTFDWESFKQVVRNGIAFLDAMISISGYPTEDYRKKAQNTRPLGLGIMGLADMLCKLNIPYNSKEAYELCGRITMTMTYVAIQTSIEMGKTYGSFADFENNKEEMIKVAQRFGISKGDITHLRNCNWTTIAPTGSTSISCDCSPGMEPLFGITYTKNISDSGEKWTFVNPIFEQKYKNESWYDEAIEKITKNHGSCRGIACVPEEVQRVWVVAHDIHWKDRIEMQAYLQKGISNSISSTINLPKTATVEDIRSLYMEAWKKGLKGITFYRDGALASQPVQFQKEEVKDVSQCRPKIRAGFTHEVITGHGKIYVTVNKDESGRILEIFTNGGKNGGVSAANLEAIARLASLALQKGVGVDAIAHTLLGISDGTAAWDKLSVKDTRPVQIVSIPDAIGQVLYRFYVKEDKVTEVEKVANEPDSCEQPAELRCPDCGGFATMQEGCIYCVHCGSRCS